MWNYWVWEGTWRVLASYRSRMAAAAAARHAADPIDTRVIAEDGGALDRYLREHCRERAAPRDGRAATGGSREGG